MSYLVLDYREQQIVLSRLQDRDLEKLYKIVIIHSYETLQ